MSNNISADTLFHFMKKFEYLEAALKQEFSPRYYKEDLTPFFGNKPVYIAMKCFCDIPLSMVREHATKYGNYAIGLSKDWGIKNNLNPVTYYNIESDFIESINKAFNASSESMGSLVKYISGNKRNCLDKKDEKVFFRTADSIINMSRALLNFKPYCGRMWDSMKNDWGKHVVLFYNEREWRKYIQPAPKTKKYEQVSAYYAEDDVDAKDIEEKNKRLASYRRIKYDYKDVKFIIVNNDDEVIKVCKMIDGIKDIDIKPDILKTKILKYEDIEANM